MLWKDGRKDGETELDRLLGEPRRAIRGMVVPIFIALLVVELNQFVDTFWVSGLGATDAEAVSVVTPLYGLMMCAGLGISVAATATISFRLGEGREAGDLVANSIILGIIFAVISSVLITLFFDVAIDIMGAGGVRGPGWEYMIPFVLMSPAVLVYTILGGALRGEGAARKSTIIQSTAAILNMVIDPLLIYVLGMGIFGAGLSTCVSALISVSIGLFWYLKGRTVVPLAMKDFRYDKQAVAEILNIGGPKTAQSIISNVTDLIQRVFLVIAGGTTAVMLYNYPWRYIGMMGLPWRAMDSAMIPVASAAYGQGDLDKMRESFSYTFKLVILAGVAAAAIMLVFAEPLMAIMTYEESMHELLPRFVWTLRVSALLVPFSALMAVESSMLQSMKRAKIAMNYFFIWAFIKLGLYALAAYGYFGIDPFEAIIYCMVLVHVFGGLCLTYLQRREFRRIQESIDAARARFRRIGTRSCGS